MICDGPFNFESNEVETQILDIAITKIASCDAVLVGGKICFTFAITNNTSNNLEGIVFRDELDENVRYIQDSFEVDGVQQEPDVLGNLIRYSMDISAGGEPVEIKFCVEVISVPTSN